MMGSKNPGLVVPEGTTSEFRQTIHPIFGLNK